MHDVKGVETIKHSSVQTYVGTNETPIEAISMLQIKILDLHSATVWPEVTSPRMH